MHWRKYGKYVLAAALAVSLAFLIAYGLGRIGTGYSRTQYSALETSLTASSDASAALAGEDWPAWVKARPGLGNAVNNLSSAFGPNAFNGTIKGAAEAWPVLEKATDFAHARAAYTRVSDNLAQIALAVRKQDKRFASVLVYYCPMTADPSSARWIQLSGNLHNPFWGKEMPDCGGEVKP